MRRGLGLLGRYYGGEGHGDRVVDQLAAGDVTYRASRVAFLAVYSLLLYAWATGLHETHPGLIAELAAFDPGVHPALGDLGHAVAAGEGAPVDPYFLLL